MVLQSPFSRHLRHGTGKPRIFAPLYQLEAQARRARPALQRRPPSSTSSLLACASGWREGATRVATRDCLTKRTPLAFHALKITWKPRQPFRKASSLNPRPTRGLIFDRFPPTGESRRRNPLEDTPPSPPDRCIFASGGPISFPLRFRDIKYRCTAERDRIFESSPPQVPGFMCR